MNQTLYQLMNWPDIEGIVYADLSNPKSILGSTKVKGGILVQSFMPGAIKASIKLSDGKTTKMELVDEAGFFAVLCKAKEIFAHSFIYEMADGSKVEAPELYDMPSLISEKAANSFLSGESVQAQELLGAHAMKVNGEEGVLFTVWAPNARRVSVVGDFNHWNGAANPMELSKEFGIFELFVPGLKTGDLYKFEVLQKGGIVVHKSDPFGRTAEVCPDLASIVYEQDAYEWQDADYIKSRAKQNLKKSAMSVLEVHIGRWMENATYTNIAPSLIDFLKKNGYTHVDFMPIMEHYDVPSLGYQTTGYFGPTSRYGMPGDFKKLVDTLHQAGFGVLMDWVPSYFPKNENGLAKFDGTALFEHQDSRQGENAWGMLNFKYSSPQVASFLKSNALYWLKEYHLDGLRMDAVDTMLYLDYGKADGTWIANEFGGNENLEAIAFLQDLNATLKKAVSGAILIAKASSEYASIIGKAGVNGCLGFDLKWNAAWGQKAIFFLECDPLFRKGRYQTLVNSLLQSAKEEALIGFSHDELRHGWNSLLKRMPGDDADARLANLRAIYSLLQLAPGKKFIYEAKSIGLDHTCFHAMEEALATLRAKEPAFYELDLQKKGFEWVNKTSAEECILSFVRRASDGTEFFVVANFTPVSYNKFKLGVPHAGKYKEIFNSDAESFGGSNVVNKRAVTAKAENCGNRKNSICVNIAPMAVMVFRVQE